MADVEAIADELWDCNTNKQYVEHVTVFYMSF